MGPSRVASSIGDMCDHGPTYTSPSTDFAQQEYDLLQYHPALNQVPAYDSSRPQVLLRRNRVNLNVIVDLSGILPEGLQDPRTG